MTIAAARSGPVVPLRQARKEFTRTHICNAAKEVFFVRGFAAPTMEQIAQAAGIQRSTLYTHFRDKDEILAAIADDYLIGLRAVVARLPGPLPTRADIETWVGDFAHFAHAERAPTEMLVTASSMAQIPPALRTFGANFVKLLAEQLPAFETAMRQPVSLSYAWAMATLRELGWALCFYAQNGDSEESANRLAVAATMFDRFIHDEN